jgi:CubicO group peptidase (beta-lactamase class C family)
MRKPWLRIPGLAMGIVEGDRIIHLKGFGIAGSDGRPVTPQTPFQINSLGKPMTGVAIMQLVEAGKLDLDAPVQRYLPWFRVADEAASARITPRHLLSHTSGLPEAAGMEQAFSEEGRPDALEQRVRALRSVQLNRPVGASYEYSNAGYMTLGMLVQEISGQPYEAYMRAYLYTPLEMRQTFTDWTEARAHGPPAATVTGLVYRWPATCPLIAPTCRPARI